MTRAWRSFREQLGHWFQREKRDLPWRRTRDPYAIWISEIMLQQTRVATVIPYYRRFLERFPTPASLAGAPEDEVLELWAGLGYYSRGRNLHRGAQFLMADHGGSMPADRDAIREIPGVGEYTSAAVASIAFGEPHPVIDGNVERVLSRQLGLEGDPRRGQARSALREAAESALDVRNPGDHNQAMMELGATVCTPRSPSCDACPVAGSCRAHELGVPEAYPQLPPRRKVEEQHWLALVPRWAGRFCVMRQAEDAPFLRGQWGLPLVQSAPSAPRRGGVARKLVSKHGFSGEIEEPVEPITHTITHRRLRVVPVPLKLDRRPEFEHRLIPRSKIASVPALFRKVIEASLD